MHDDPEPNEPHFADKRRTRLIIHRASTPSPNDASTSYFGGLPRLPPEFAWPTVPRRQEDGDGDGPVVPTFIAQIDLSTLPFWRGRELFPDTGTIYVFCNTQFCDVGDPYCRILYYKGSSATLPERPPPPGLMRVGGTYDYHARSWLCDDDPLVGVDHKFGLHFEWVPRKLPDHEHPPFDHPEWCVAHRLYSTHPLLMRSWPQTPLYTQTLRAGLIAQAQCTKTNYNGELWAGYEDLMELVHAMPQCSGEPFRLLGDAERCSFRRDFAGFAERLSQGSEGAARFSGGSYGLSKLIDETAFWCTARGFAKGDFDKGTESGELHAAMESAAARWRHWKWPNQVLGAGTVVQNAPYDHAGEALLLQVSGVDFLAGSATDCVLQFWVPASELKAGNFGNTIATLECS